MNLQSQDYLAKLLAKENLTVQHGNYQTASFDVTNRVLNLPLWADKGKAVHDLLVGHEVGHALYTPADGWHDSEKEIPGVPRDMINIIEDIRIEKKIQRTYPGITRAFKQGYKVLFDDNLFGTVGKDLTKYNFMDKLNIHSKGRGYAPVVFNETEQMFVDLAMAVETWEDVLDACQEINDWLANREDYAEDEEHATTVVAEDTNEQAEDTNKQSNSTAGSDSEDQTEEDDEDSTSQSGDKEKSVTDQAQRDNESELLDTNEDGKQPLYSSGISYDNIKRLVVSYPELRKARNEYAPNYGVSAYTSNELEPEFEKFLNGGINKTVNLMAKEFERKKAAWEYSRSTEAKKGSLNMNKLHQYQYSEDIFLTVDRLAQAKSHGIFMLLDFSGSMNGILSDVISQTITIALFCKKVNIPFEAYSFTSGHRSTNTLDDIDSITDDHIGDNDIENIQGLKLVQILSSSLNRVQFKESIKHLFAVKLVRSYHRAGGYTQSSTCALDSMGGTPLIQSLIACEPLINALRAKTGIQNMNVMILTDGIADAIRVANQYSHNHINSNNIDIEDVRIKFGSKIISGKSRAELTESTIKILGELTKSTMIGFFLATNRHDFYYGYKTVTDDPRAFHHDGFNGLAKEFNNVGVMNFKKCGGYDDYFIVKVGKKADDEFEVKPNKNGNDIKINDIKRQFRSFSKSNKQSKQLVNKITDAVAA